MLQNFLLENICVCVLIQLQYTNLSCVFFRFQSSMDKKATRKKSIENRLRLGQFVTQRQGATFVENWVDGYAFTDLLK